jgi:hypothetical protein
VTAKLLLGAVRAKSRGKTRRFVFHVLLCESTDLDVCQRTEVTRTATRAAVAARSVVTVPRLKMLKSRNRRSQAIVKRRMTVR